MPGRERRGRVPGEDPGKRAGEGTSGGGIEEGRPRRRRREGFTGGRAGEGALSDPRRGARGQVAGGGRPGTPRP